MLILKILRKSPHRLSLKEIVEKAGHSKNEVKSVVHYLLCKEYIRQDSHDKVEWNDDNATFYTIPQKRKEIDELIK